MPAAVETMFYTREKPWHGLGTMVQEAPTSADALRLAGLDWTVDQYPVFADDNLIPGYKANIRSSDKKALGIVSDRYKVVQNVDAFSFTDNIIGGDVHYETAGSLLGGKKVWLLAKMPDRLIAGDKTEPYMCFTNTHDGTGAVRVCMTPIRVVCNNTLNLALESAQRAWSVRHVGNISAKLDEAKQCLELADTYMDKLAEKADQMANTTVSDARLREILDQLFPSADDMTDLQKKEYPEDERPVLCVLVLARSAEVSEYRLGRGKCNERSRYPQRTASGDERLSGEQLQQGSGRALPN